MRCLHLNHRISLLRLWTAFWRPWIVLHTASLDCFSRVWTNMLYSALTQSMNKQENLILVYFQLQRLPKSCLKITYLENLLSFKAVNKLQLWVANLLLKIFVMAFHGILDMLTLQEKDQQDMQMRIQTCSENKRVCVSSPRWCSAWATAWFWIRVSSPESYRLRAEEDSRREEVRSLKRAIS